MNEIYTRVSTRKYTDEPVEEEKLLAILRAAMQAPSAGNQQPWEFYVVTDRGMLEALSRVSPYAGCTRGAPVAVVSAYREKLWAPDYAQIDMSIAMENLWLETAAQGLGGVWLGIAPMEDRMKAVDFSPAYFVPTQALIVRGDGKYANATKCSEVDTRIRSERTDNHLTAVYRCCSAVFISIVQRNSTTSVLCYVSIANQSIACNNDVLLVVCKSQ